MYSLTARAGELHNLGTWRGNCRLDSLRMGVIRSWELESQLNRIQTTKNGS